MKKKLFFGIILLALMVSCPEPDNNKPGKTPVPDVLITAISVAGVNISPLPAPSASIEGVKPVSVVVNTERPPTGNEDPNRIWYKPAQPIAVTLANEFQTVYYQVTSPGENLYDDNDIVLPPAEKDGAVFTRNIGITLPNNDGFQIGQAVWLRVVASDESKTEYYKINVVNQTHDTAINAFKIGGYDVLNPDNLGHIGPWFPGASWADAVAGLVNPKQSEISSLPVVITPRNNAFELSKPKLEYAKTTGSEPSEWSAAAPTFAAGDVLAVKITASNGKTAGYMKVTINAGGSSFLSSLKVNNKDISLGAPSMDIKNAGPAYRVEDGKTLTGTAVTWAVVPVAEDTSAAISWALAAKGATPSSFNNSTSFDSSHNYLYIRVVSQNGSTTMYYLVIYDERPKDTEHIMTGSKNVPVYRFTIPPGKTWADLGTYPTLRVKILQDEAEFNLADGYSRNFIFGEFGRFNRSDWDASTLTGYVGDVDWGRYLMLIINKRVKDWAMDIPNNVPAPNTWYIAEYPINNPPDWRAPWDGSRPDIASRYFADQFYPSPATTGDVYFGYGITHDQQHEYYIKELSLVSEDGNFIISCDLLGNGRIDSDVRTTGFVTADTASDVIYLRELVSDPTLK